MCCIHSVGAIVWLSWRKSGPTAVSGCTVLPTRSIPRTTASRQSARTSGPGLRPEFIRSLTSRSRTGTTRRIIMSTLLSSAERSRAGTIPRSVTAEMLTRPAGHQAETEARSFSISGPSWWTILRISAFYPTTRMPVKTSGYSGVKAKRVLIVHCIWRWKYTSGDKRFCCWLTVAGVKD